MIKLLIDYSSGKQEVVSVHKTGFFNDLSKVVWNELIDGQLPAITIGGMIRQGSSLVFDQTRKDQHDAAIADELAEKTRLEEIETELKGDAAFNAFKAMTNAEQNDWFSNSTAAQKNKILLWLLKDRARR